MIMYHHIEEANTHTHKGDMIMANPYELRYEIYQQAQQRLTDEFYQEHSLWQDFEDWKRDREAEGNTVSVKSPVSCRPKFPNHDQILVEAEKIYEFVQKKN